MNRDVSVAWIGLGLIALGMLPALWAIGELSDGLAELPRHWWSGLAIVPLVLGVAVTALGLVRLSKSAT